MLKDANLLRRDAFIDGAWSAADSGRTFDVFNPASGELLAKVADCGAEETQRAVAAADRALPEWRAKTATARAALLRRWHDLLLEHVEDLALLMT